MNLSYFSSQAVQNLTGLQFGFGITDPTNNPVCLDANGDPVLTPTLTNPANCAARLHGSLTIVPRGSSVQMGRGDR